MTVSTVSSAGPGRRTGRREGDLSGVRCLGEKRSSSRRRVASGVIGGRGKHSESLSTAIRQFKIKGGEMSAKIVDSKLCPSIQQRKMGRSCWYVLPPAAPRHTLEINRRLPATRGGLGQETRRIPSENGGLYGILTTPVPSPLFSSAVAVTITACLQCQRRQNRPRSQGILIHCPDLSCGLWKPSLKDSFPSHLTQNWPRAKDAHPGHLLKPSAGCCQFCWSRVVASHGLIEFGRKGWGPRGPEGLWKALSYS